MLVKKKGCQCYADFVLASFQHQVYCHLNNSTLDFFLSSFIEIVFKL